MKSGVLLAVTPGDEGECLPHQREGGPRHREEPDAEAARQFAAVRLPPPEQTLPRYQLAAQRLFERERQFRAVRPVVHPRATVRERRYQMVSQLCLDLCIDPAFALASPALWGKRRKP